MEKTAKIVRFHEAGGPKVLRTEALPIPEPGPGEVRLRAKAVGLNRAEVMFRNNPVISQWTPRLMRSHSWLQPSCKRSNKA